MEIGLRIKTRPAKTLQFNELANTDEHNNYFSRLIKLIPAEILTLYSMGHTNIPDDEVVAEAVFGFVCCVLVVLSRAYATKSSNSGPQWAAVFISLTSFIIWLYLESPIFVILGIQLPWLGTIIMAVWLFVVPYFYKGEVIEE